MPSRPSGGMDLAVQGSHLLTPSRYMLLDEDLTHIRHYEKPAMISLLPDVTGRTALDVYCGRGLYSAHLCAQGARQVIAVDPTEAMLDLTRGRCREGGVQAEQGDFIAGLAGVADASVDLIVSSLSLGYAEDIGAAFAQLRRVAATGAALVFSVSHPMADWLHVQTNRPDSYFDTSLIDMHWCGFNQSAPFIDQYRRSLSDLLMPLLRAGFRLTTILEPEPPEEMRQVSPEQYASFRRAPGLLCIRAEAAD